MEDNMAENTPKSKEEMEKAVEDLQIDPADLDAVVGGINPVCATCYTTYSGSTPETPPAES
jgi:cytochrome c556